MIDEPNVYYEQLLSVIRPNPLCPNGKILLCKWLTGDFKDRYTGLWGPAPTNDDHSLRQALVRLAATANGTSSYPKIQSDKLELMAVLRFDVPVDNLEYIYVTELGPSALNTPGSRHNSDSDSPLTPTGKVSSVNPFTQNATFICEWFDLDKIPYAQMPADDLIWYAKVLDGKRVEGSFSFAGEPKYTVKNFVLNEVKHLVEPGDIIAPAAYD
ncbi:uncharacterized protein LOC129587356 [Paramacrobiotus metropolitanus]|uniref:uncharacterized protein LOC129587356 n=1 Tax=Paramacrobiotus metropolitanus TaxID=2943436 RepID=UPI002445FA56|nr:uncharacterized protein LOC129587356 [Paramacrobiotus metropolitanus]